MASLRKTIMIALAGVIATATAGSFVAHAQDYPSRLIRIIVPFPPGGNPDLAARLVANQMAIDFGQSVIIENKPGANGGIGAKTVARADPDGYTLLVANLGILGINPVVRENLMYDTAKDFLPISRLAISPLVLIVNPSVKVSSVEELVARAKKEPSKLSYASAGVGSAAHMAGALFGQMAGVRLLHVPYKGASEAAPATAAGTVSMTFSGQGAGWPLVEAGHVKALGMTGLKRSPTFRPSRRPASKVTTFRTGSACWHPPVHRSRSSTSSTLKCRRRWPTRRRKRSLRRWASSRPAPPRRV